MRPILAKIGLDSVRPGMLKEASDACRECRAREKPGNSTMSSVSLPSKFNDEVESDLMFYKKHITCHICDRCIRWSAGQKIPDRTMHTIIDTYRYCRVLNEPAKVLRSDGEGALDNDAAKAILKDKGAELRMRPWSARDRHLRHLARRQAFN